MNLHCRNLDFFRDGFHTLKGITLDLGPGKFIAVLGRNGAGKTTLFRCLAGLEPRCRNQVFIGDKSLKHLGQKAAARQISMVFQTHDRTFAYRVIDFVVMGRSPFLPAFALPGPLEYELAMQQLADLGAAHLADREVNRISGGEKQLVLLARALLQSKKILFLDEPTNHLDYKNRYQMLYILDRLKRRHDTLMVVSLHDPTHALNFADEVILMEGGAIIAQGRTREVLTADRISSLYGLPARRYCTDGIDYFQPGFMAAATAGQVLLVTGKRQGGKTTFLSKVIDRLKSEPEPLSIGGTLCPGTMEQGIRTRVEVTDLGSGEKALFARRDPADRNFGRTGGFEITPEGLALFLHALDLERHRRTRLMVVDEIGPFELEGQGGAPRLFPLLSLPSTRHIWVVRQELVEKVIQTWMLNRPQIVNIQDADAFDRALAFAKNGYPGRTDTDDSGAQSSDTPPKSSLNIKEKTKWIN